jgi:hypothetical protein
MDTFKGTMRMAGEHDAVPVEARIDDLRVVLVVEGVEVGAWARENVRAQPTGAGVSLELGSDRVELDVTDRSALLARLEPPAEEISRSERRRRRRRLPPWPLLLLGALTVAVVVAAVLFPIVTGSVLLLIGAALLVLGALAYNETRIALRLPLGLAPVHFVIGGGILVVVGAGLILLG